VWPFYFANPAAQLIEIFQVDDVPQLSPRYNIAPTQLIVCVRTATESPTREAVMMRWGLIPFWAKDNSIGNRLINARSETVAEKPSFRNAFKKRRCLIMADGFYEWQKLPDRTKQPHLIYLPEQRPFAIAGLWETWRDPAQSEPRDEVISCTLLTTSANSEMQPLHDRMPVILDPADWPVWLSDSASVQQRQNLLRPLPDGSLEHHPVSTVVNRPTHDAPDCVERI
jgi:putative SOS response-associated peptidase YedK